MERTVKEVHGSLQVTLPKELAVRSGIVKGMHLRFEAHAAGILLRSSASDARVLWTIGYEGETPGSFIAELSRRGIQRLFDVRELPLSRRKGFSKTPLAAELAKAGIEYVHQRDLGAPARIRKPFVAGGAFATFRDGYLQHLRAVRPALDHVERDALSARTAIMCVEYSHSQCHRQFIAQAIAERGFEIRHIQPERRA